MQAEAAQLLEYVLECLSVPVSVHDGSGVLVYQNAAHLNLFGERTGQQACYGIFGARDGAATASILAAEGECVVEERLPDGGLATVRVVRLPDQEGCIAEVMNVRAALAPSAEVETFVHNAAHDLKTPLVSIKGYAELLQRELGGSGGRAPTFLERLLIQAHRMETLLEDLLEYARIGTEEADGELLDPGQAAHSAWQGLQDVAEASCARLETQSGLPQVRFSPVRLHQVLTNLLSNAIRYRRDDQPPRIRLCAHSGEVAPGQVALALEDNGVGVPMEERERIFALFHRANRSCVGSGVGLAIVRRIIEENGGAVWVEPVADSGSRFVFSLPAALTEGDGR